MLAQLKLTGKSDDETARAGARTHSRSRSGFDSAMPAQKLSEARWRSGYRTASATMMSLSQTSVVLTSAQRPSRETVIPPSSAIRDTRKGSVPTRCPIPSLNRYKLMASASGSKLTKTFFDDQPFASRWRERVVAVASDGDGGDACFTHDDRARVDTKEAQDWISQTIADAVGGHGRHD